jgi:hypothetical protein
MSDQADFPLSRQPKGQATLHYDGPSIIHHDGRYQIKISSDKLFHGEEGCTEKLTLLSAKTRHSVNLRKFIKTGSVDARFVHSGSDKSIFVLDLTFATREIFAGDHRRRIREGTTMVLPMRLEFGHEATERIHRAVTPGRSPSPCEKALLEEKVFEYKASLLVDVQVSSDPRNAGS